MPQPASARLGLIAASSSDDMNLWPNQIQAIVAALEATAAEFVVSAAARPVASAANLGSFFVAFSTGVVSFSTGTAWLDLNADGALPPVGSTLGFGGSGDPPAAPGGKWLLADGRLIDRTVHLAYSLSVGNKFNGGIDPGGNLVRIQDKRGRVTIGPDSMGTARGDAVRLPNSARLAGQSGGAERHTMTAAEMPSHTHANLTYSPGGDLDGRATGAGNLATAIGSLQAPYAASTGGGLPHNNLQPYEVENMIVRVL